MTTEARSQDPTPSGAMPRELPATGIRHLGDYDTSRRYAAVVLSSEPLTGGQSKEEVRELVLEVEPADGEGELVLEVGQSIGVLAPGQRDLGQKHHLRLYSIADLPLRGDGGALRITLCVKRCSYVDEYNGEEYRGVASNYLCDLRAGDSLTLTGPYGLPFEIPADHSTNLVLIGTGTGIAPFRALIKHLYRNVPDWSGRVLLFYGARSGLELLYMNDERDDFAQYYDEETFRAFKALSPRPHWNDPIAWDQALSQRGAELLEMLGDRKTRIYVAGLESMRSHLDVVFATILGSKEQWLRRRAELLAAGQWVELLY